MTKTKNQNGKNHIRIYLKDIFGFAEHEEKTTYGFGHKLTLPRNNDDSVLNQADAINIGKIEINAIELYVPHYTPSIPQQAILSKQISNKVPTELQYVERGVFFMKEVNTQNF